MDSGAPRPPIAERESGNSTEMALAASLTIHSFPSEILGEIFQSCLSTFKPTCNMDTRKAPWVLGQICGSWRAVVIFTPELWRTIYVTLDNRRRSPSHPSPQNLTIAWNCCYNVPVPAFAPGAGYADSRITSLGRVRGSVPSLHNLTLRPHAARFSDTLSVIDVFAEAPSLRNVHRSNCLQDISYTLPWAQLTSYTETYSIVSRLLTVPREMPNLVFCSVRQFRRDVLIQGFGDGMVHLPHLRHLYILHDSSHDIDCMMLVDRLTLPRLDILNVNTTQHRIFMHLAALLHRSACQLHTFIFASFFRITDAAFVGLLGQVPTLTELELRCRSMPRRIAVALTCAAFTECLLPALRVLKVESVDPLPDEFTPMIETGSHFPTRAARALVRRCARYDELDLRERGELCDVEFSSDDLCGNINWDGILAEMLVNLTHQLASEAAEWSGARSLGWGIGQSRMTSGRRR
ncbi:hypothetical protein C8R43DRAFT_945702 [Mycena crocata]|nr:hypothetical protein C8R43DRAFT_945702 [Mycena crocata]